MSSRPRPSRGGGRPARGPRREERRRATSVQQFFTPASVLVAGLILLAIGGFAWYKSKIEPMKMEVQSLQTQISSKRTELNTKKKKAELRADVEALRDILNDKIQREYEHFLHNQLDQSPFLAFLLNNIFGELGVAVKEVRIRELSYTFTYQSTPFNIIPAGIAWPSDQDEPNFNITYQPEPAGENRPLDKAHPQDYLGSDYIRKLEQMDPEELRESEEEDLKYFRRGIWNPELGRQINQEFGKPDSFTQPWDFEAQVYATYEQIQEVIRLMHESSQYYFSVQCISNDPQENQYVNFTRVVTLWTLKFSTYYLNPDGTASGKASSLPTERGC